MSIKSSIAAALKQNFWPGLVLQLFAALVLGVYFLMPDARPAYALFGQLKQNYGYGYSFIATAIFGGLIPFMYLWFSKSFESGRNLASLFLFYICFWGLKGIEVDFFYRLQGDWFGYENSVRTIACKAAVDQFIYSAFWAAPSITIAYLWVEQGYSFSRWIQAMDREFFCEKIPTIILSNWMVWIPAVSIVYAMPQDLQIPLFNLVLCFWVLLLAVLNKK